MLYSRFHRNWYWYRRRYFGTRRLIRRPQLGFGGKTRLHIHEIGLITTQRQWNIKKIGSRTRSCSLPHAHSLLCSHTLVITHSYDHPLLYSPTLTLTHSYAHTLLCSPTLILTQSYSHTIIFTLSHAYTVTPTPTCIHSHWHTCCLQTLKDERGLTFLSKQ